MEQLALYGGPQSKTTPFSTGKRFGEEEATELLEALEQNTLFYHFGEKVKHFLSDFNVMYGSKYSVATSSGTAALHVALGAAGVTVGDEVITSPITDQGTLIGILYQNAVPVFADLEPNTYNLDPKSVIARITPKTKAIIVVHLAGNPCDMDPIMDIAHRYGIKVIEDCAQAYLTKYKGRLVGTIGNYGCFSTNDFKHISTGDGGMVLVNSGEEKDYATTHAFADKNYRRLGTTLERGTKFIAPNYRMTELQGAVGIAQLKKLPWICERRRTYGDRMNATLSSVPGIHIPKVNAHDECTYWFYMFRLEMNALTCDRDEFCKALEAEGIPNRAGYIPEVCYMQPLFQNRQAYLGSHFPFDLSDTTYSQGICPVAEEILQTAVQIPLNEFYSEQDVEDIIRALQKVAAHYAVGKN
ncbi:DegT/DnrJ/EryC1/StrS family aminotransferase [Paenibacillus sp. N3/727]|uniref:DegT/DnrJ/EryC1/StrS family aminotransferase n=1 Tax=Paenibacillus sp. N3/727 TaxID=2925845 RepID=UPI001F537AB5|nr:DegT/DnrJ/EryC1/StrS family aminotransferase [Paenibacillus sp. N3/727]UNK16439.1 DegT/DnrJ/EryC1/StrS family aminotransferase [Paenibacillus sp. N3/727]